MLSGAEAELTAGCDEPFAQLGVSREIDAASVVIAWPTVPVEIVRAAGFRAIVARSAPTGTPAADEHLEAGVFPARLRHLLEAALTGRLAHVAAIVVPRTSEPDYKCFLYLREFARRRIGGPYPPTLLLDLLQSDAAAVAAYNRERLAGLFEQLLALPGARAADRGIAGEIGLADRARAAGRRLLALRADAPRVSGTEAMSWLGAFWHVPPARYEELAGAVASAFTAGSARVRRGMRVLVAGAPVATQQLHAAIEAHGATVVDEITPHGADAVRLDVNDGDDALLSLAGHYRALPGTPRVRVDVMMSRFEGALDDVDAAVISLPPDDATFGWDYPRLRGLLSRRGVAHTVVTSDPSLPLSPRDVQCLAALLQAERAAHG